MLDPSQYDRAAAYDLLDAAAKGWIGVDRRLLHALLDDPSKSLADLLRFALESRPNDAVVLEEDLISIFRHLKTPETLPFFVELVRRNPYEISDELVEAFSQFPAESSELLLNLYRELGETEGAEVAFLLAALRVRDERIRRVLLRRLETDPGDGAFCLGLYGDPATRPDLERALASAATDWVRQSVEEALADLDRPAPQAEHPAFDIWDLYPERADPQFDILSDGDRLEFLSSQSADYRAAAAGSFFNEDLSGAVRNRLLEAARRDPATEVRARAWEALGGASERDEIRAALTGRLNDGGAPMAERCGAMVALAGAAGEAGVRERILEFYAIPEARGKALETMYRSLDRSFAPFFPPHLDDPDLEIRRRAIWGVGHLGIHGEAGRLRDFFDDGELREDALFAYTLAVPFEISRGRAGMLLRKVDQAAGGLSASETELVQWAVDDRLVRHSLAPVFDRDQVPEPEETVAAAKAGRNDPCPCGSGKKFKKCCGA